ncbi:hypothetical protein M441DRAFT_52861 [Trichoderma asperellum CBS 433.97]|uniref:Uncharacterized protein n=1 Tax=Trichoderma asperellum (strain ATCC 204424 / CBS 433.97 / NBRC 101777) TaxID=1042311 RepID=A0A2T3ZMR6_TRIA4|nr:hypothetical protein M441DRAFT_52861 [Trichoderma asperellum CBS 433.97]PTB46087.1 hypothetical protein M441DRAFT_52861 [Trichoderma asperellum CBS 433.97]
MSATISMVDRKAAASDFLPPTTVDMPIRQEIQHGPSNPAAERRVREAIEKAATRNSQLLSELEATAHGPGLLGNNQIKIEHVDKRLADLEPEVAKAVAAANQQLKSHKAYRDSFGKKWVYTLLKKRDAFDEKAQREEKAYHQVLEKRHKAEGTLNELKADKAALVVEMKTLEELAGRHAAAHKGIDNLYSEIFDGPTAGFPDEDEQEQAHKVAKVALQERTEALKAAVRGVKAAQVVKLAIERALFEKQRAGFENHSDIFSQRSFHVTLSRCIAYIDRGIELTNQAIDVLETAPGPEQLQTKNKLEQHLITARTQASSRLKDKSQNTALLERLGNVLISALEAQKEYLAAMKLVSESCRNSIRQTARALEDERRALQQIRQSAFETTVGFGAAAPAYHECCDRAPGFENDSHAQTASIQDPVVAELPVDSEPPPDYVFPDEESAPNTTETAPEPSTQAHTAAERRSPVSNLSGEVTPTNPRGLAEVS